MKNNIIPIIVIITGLIISGVIVYMAPQQQFAGRIVSSEEAGEIATDFINETLLQDQDTVSLTDISEESGLYRIDFLLQGNSFSSYISKDGKDFFPEKIDVENFEMPASPAGGTDMVGDC